MEHKFFKINITSSKFGNENIFVWGSMGKMCAIWDKKKYGEVKEIMDRFDSALEDFIAYNDVIDGKTLAQTLVGIVEDMIANQICIDASIENQTGKVFYGEKSYTQNTASIEYSPLDIKENKYSQSTGKTLAQIKKTRLGFLIYVIPKNVRPMVIADYYELQEDLIAQGDNRFVRFLKSLPILMSLLYHFLRCRLAASFYQMEEKTDDYKKTDDYN